MGPRLVVTPVHFGGHLEVKPKHNAGNPTLERPVLRLFLPWLAPARNCRVQPRTAIQEWSRRYRERLDLNAIVRSGQSWNPEHA